jgi:hypothetical protein
MAGQKPAELENPFQTFDDRRFHKTPKNLYLGMNLDLFSGIPDSNLDSTFTVAFHLTGPERIKELQNKKSSGSKTSD